MFGTSYILDHLHLIKEMRQAIESTGEIIHENPVKNAGMISTVERYHDAISSSLIKIREDFDRELK